MKTFVFTPYTGMSEILFGMERGKLRSALGPFKEFKKSKFSKNTSDDFTDFHVFYDAENTVEAVEVFPDVRLVFKEKNLFDLTYAELKAFVADDTAKEEDETFTSFHHGMSFSKQGDDGKVESILVFKKGYWD